MPCYLTTLDQIEDQIDDTRRATLRLEETYTHLSNIGQLIYPIYPIDLNCFIFRITQNKRHNSERSERREATRAKRALTINACKYREE